jgi:predicted nucleotidyltransferase
MAFETEEITRLLTDRIRTMKEVQSIGISGSKNQLPKAGEGDIDVFIYCDTIPELEKRQAIVNQLRDILQEGKFNVFEGGHWGIGDFVLINGVETWLMYFTVNETLNDVESILIGDYPDKLDNYYYPIGRCAMLKDINVLVDKNDFLYSLKKRLSVYPDKLAEILIQYHLNELEDIEDLERAVTRKDVLFYHFAMDIAIDHFLQALFAMNKTYFPSRKRTLDLIKNFIVKPERCDEQLLDVVRFGACSESINHSYELWSNMVNNLKRIYED